MSLTVVCWRWGPLFGPEYVFRLRSMLRRHLHLPHRLVCITDNPGALGDIETLPITRFADTPRCRRRMWQYSCEAGRALGPRILSIDLDVVIVDDITPLVDRAEPIALWKVGYAGVYSGAFVLFDAGALHGAFAAYAAEPEAYPQRAQPKGIGSDQAMINLWLRESGTPVAEWTERNGLTTWFGDGYARSERFGMGPGRPGLPPGARIVVLGSADKGVLEECRCDWVREHWR